jgi:glycosyltransferase involved in cell wall biosynthesis
VFLRASKTTAIFLPDLRGGGAERVAVNLANELVARGHAVDMVLLSATGEFLSALRPEVKVVDLKVGRVRWALGPLVRYLRSRRPSAMLACMWPLTILAPLARMIAKVPARLIVAEHTTWSRSELLKRPTLGWQIRASMHLFFQRVNAIVTVSEGAADDLARFAHLNRKTITVIYNPVVGDEKSLSTEPLEPGDWWSGTHKRLLAVGTLTRVKDYTTLLNALALLRQKVDARLLILGEGECRDSLRAHVKQLGVEASVFMHGFVSDPSPYYSRTDLHVLSSTSEGLPTVIIEALAAGAPVVSTDCPSGPREILSDGRFGRLVPVGDVAALATAMQASLSETPDRVALKLRSQDFSIDKAVDQYERLLFR